MGNEQQDPPDVATAEEGAGSIIRPSDGCDEDLSPLAFIHSVALTPGYSGPARPDPEGDALRARIAEQRRTGEWEAWFIDLPEEQDEYLRLAGFPRRLRAIAAPELKRLYPDSVCRRMLKGEQDQQVIKAFFSRWPPFIVPLLRVGLDLEVARPWSDHKLLRDLRSFESFATAQTELAIWASLARFGYRPDREPPGPDGRHPDFAVYIGAWRYIVEVKTLCSSAGEKLAYVLRNAMQIEGEDLRQPGQSARVLATGALRELLGTPPGRQKIAGSDGQRELGILHQQVLRLKSDGVPLGRHTVGDWFRIEIVAGSEHPAGMVAAAVWEGLEEDRRVVRTASLVETALPQIPPDAAGVPLIDIGQPIHVDAVARELYRRSREKPVHFTPVAFVVLRWEERVSLVQSRSTGAVIPFRGRLTLHESRLVKALIG